MINSDFLFNRILQNVGLDTLHNSLIKDKTDFVILVKPGESNHTELYGFNEELHEGLPTSLPDIKTSDENITDIIKELRVITDELLETIETPYGAPFINTTEDVTTDGAVEALSSITTLSTNVTDAPDTAANERVTHEMILTTESITEQNTQTSSLSANSTIENSTNSPTPSPSTDFNDTYTTATMETSSSLLENNTESATQFSTENITQENYVTTFVPDYDVEGSVVVGEIIETESIVETSGDGNQFRELGVDFLPRIDFSITRLDIYFFKNF